MFESERPIEWEGQPGQAVDVEDVRGELGIAADWSVVQSVVDDRVKLLFIPPEHNRSLKGSLAAYTDVRIPDEDAFHQACEDAWAEAAAERDARIIAEWQADHTERNGGDVGASTMISFKIGNVRFHYRAAGVFLHQEHVLLCTVDGLDFWFIPGGRCEAMETSADTVVREIREELDVTARIERLLWVVEHFFTHAGEAGHELGLYYLMALPPGSSFLDVDKTFHGDEHGERMTCRWFPLAELERMRIYPIFLHTALRHIPDTINHIVYVDNRDEREDGNPADRL